VSAGSPGKDVGPMREVARPPVDPRKVVAPAAAAAVAKPTVTIMAPASTSNTNLVSNAASPSTTASLANNTHANTTNVPKRDKMIPPLRAMALKNATLAAHGGNAVEQPPAASPRKATTQKRSSVEGVLMFRFLNSCLCFLCCRART
jgi:hypothetical protein